MSQQINLYNPVFLKQKHYVSALTMVQALAVVLAGALGIYAFEVSQNRTLEAVLAEADRQQSAQREQLVKFSREFLPQGASRTLADELAQLEQRLQQRQALLGDLKTGVGGNVQGFSTYLRALARQATPGVWLTGLDIDKGTALIIRGRALESQLVPAYIRALNREAPMQGRPIGELKMTAFGGEGSGVATSGPSRYIEFSISIPLREKP